MRSANLSLVLDTRTATDHFPGIGRYVVNLARALIQVAPDLSLALLHDPSVASTRLTLPDLPRIACPVSPFSIRQQWQVPRLLRHAGAALYHSPYYLMPYRPGVPTVFTCHDFIPLIYPEYFRASQRLFYRLTHMLALQAATMTIAVSQATQADLLRYFRVDARRIVVIPEAASAHLRPQPSAPIVAVRHKYALPENYVLYLGSNKPHKNLVRLIDAWRTVNSQFPNSNWKLVIAGHWENRYPEAKQRVTETGLEECVLFIGSVGEADLPALYSGATLFAFPSLYEGFGLPVLEAMVCGTPVISSNTSSLPEVAGEAALLVDPRNPDALAEAMSRVLQNQELRQSMREKGLERAACFSWEHTARKTLVVYEHCPGRK
jgi:glycosyltransferase involved in cell wall biosynthesis